MGIVYRKNTATKVIYNLADVCIFPVGGIDDICAGIAVAETLLVCEQTGSIENHCNDMGQQRLAGAGCTHYDGVALRTYVRSSAFPEHLNRLGKFAKPGLHLRHSHKFFEWIMVVPVAGAVVIFMSLLWIALAIHDSLDIYFRSCKRCEPIELNIARCQNLRIFQLHLIATVERTVAYLPNTFGQSDSPEFSAIMKCVVSNHFEATR